VNAAETPFEFFTVAYLTRIGNQSAGNLEELLAGLEQCSDASIFHHTFQTLSAHHFLTEGFSNDFAQWALADANRDALAEQFAALDIRDYTSIAALTAFPQFSRQEALDRFYFCESLEVTMPFSLTAANLDQFRDGVATISHASFHFHFVTSRLRLQFRTNDFSNWLAGSLGLDSLAENINHIDIYTNTLDSARAKMLRLVDRERRKNEHDANPS
jgi:Family of unknown function (DUF5752)